MAKRFLGSPWAVESVWRRVGQSRPAGEKPLGPRNLPLSGEGKRVLAFAAEEADLISSMKVRTGDLLLCLASGREVSRGRDTDNWGSGGKNFDGIVTRLVSIPVAGQTFSPSMRASIGQPSQALRARPFAIPSPGSMKRAPHSGELPSTPLALPRAYKARRVAKILC